MIDIIIMGVLILGIIMVTRKSKQKRKVFRNIGLVLIVLALIYIVPSFLSGFYHGFLDGASHLN